MLHDDTVVSARVPADVDTPDKIVYGLTARQLAILTVAAVLEYGIWRALDHRLPTPIVIGMLVPVAGLAFGLAVGRRDGLPLDAWLLGAIRHAQAPKRLAPLAEGGLPAMPSWAPAVDLVPAPSVLRLPAEAISNTGVIDADDRAVALVACTTTNIGLRTGDEQAALIGGFARWLNSLSGPVQIVVSAQRFDLASHAQRIADRAAMIPNQALADTAADYAEFLAELAVRCDPLQRTVTVAVTATGPARNTEVARRADQTASGLAALGVQTAVLDGGQVTGVLTVATDPYTPADASWPRSLPDAPIHLGDLT
jgi:PrgI family protein